jgi:ketosteroid isomerase-like protein
MAQTPLELVKAMYEAMARADIEWIMAHTSPEVTITQDPALPWGGHHVGHDGLADFALTLVGTIESAVTIDNIFQAGDHVVQHGRTKGTVRATGVAFDIAECHVWTIRDGLAVAGEFYIDSEAMLAALDAEGPQKPEMA